LADFVEDQPDVDLAPTREHRLAGPDVEPLAYRKRKVARMLDISERTLERLLAGGKFPRPDAHAGRCPLWMRSTLVEWIAKGGGR
jgi:hypothetical protein